MISSEQTQKSVGSSSNSPLVPLFQALGKARELWLMNSHKDGVSGYGNTGDCASLPPDDGTSHQVQARALPFQEKIRSAEEGGGGEVTSVSRAEAGVAPPPSRRLDS